MPRPRKYPQELMDRGVRLVFESGRPIAQVAADLGVHPETLRKRVRQTSAMPILPAREDKTPPLRYSTPGGSRLAGSRSQHAHGFAHHIAVAHAPSRPNA
jgi:transposase-like protein